MPYSITSSARLSNVGGILRPSALAVLSVHHQFELRWLFDWQVGRLRTLENLVNENGRTTPWILKIGSIGQKQALLRVFSRGRDCRQPISDGHDSNLVRPPNDERLRPLPHQYRKRLFKCVQPVCFDRDKRQP